MKYYCSKCNFTSRKTYYFMNHLNKAHQTKILNNNSLSILIPIYNTPINYLNDCFNSIINQTFQGNIEIVIVNDGSNNEVKNYLENISFDKRFTIKLEHNKKNYGIAKSLNIGLNLCSNELIARMDSDDIMINNRLELQYNFFIENPNIDILGGGLQLLYPSKTGKNKSKPPLIVDSKFIANGYKGAILYHPCVMYKKSCIKELNGYDESLIGLAEDYDLWIRALISKKIIFNIQNIIIKYRCHHNQLSKNFKNSVEYRRKKIFDKLKKSLNIL